MNTKLDLKRVLIFLSFAFGIAWTAGLAVFLTGGLTNSPELFPGSGVTLAFLLIALFYMWAPGVAHILTRLVTCQGWAGSGLRPNLKRGWLFWLAAWFLPGILTILGMGVYFLLFPHMFDSGLSMIRANYTAQGLPVPSNLWAVAITQTALAMVVAPLINSLATFGEEFGWRAYLQPMLMRLGTRKALLWMGVIWGVWHAPVIAMGHNYGLGYAGAPWLGILAMIWFCFVAGVFLGWLTVRGGSVWPAVIGHAAINGIAALGLLFVVGEPNLLLGPSPLGLVAMLPWSVLALWLFFRPAAWQSQAPALPQQQAQPVSAD